MPPFNEFCGRAYRSQSLNVDAEQLINRYLEKVESPGGKSRFALYPCPGFQLFATAPQTAQRGMLEQNGRAFFVSGPGLYELEADGTVTLRGTMAQDSNPAQLCTNGTGGDQLGVTSGGLFYCLDLVSNVFAPVDDGGGDPVTGAFCGFVDGYAVVLDVNTSTLKWSALEDMTTFDAADAAQRNTAGDRWRSMLVTHREVWLFGGQRTDVWATQGNPDQAFEPIQGVFIEMGVAAGFSTATVDNTPVWLGQNETGTGMVWRGTSGYSPTRISDHGVEFAISQYTTTSDAVAWTYQDQGHAFYVLNFPTEGKTWVWDAATETWHERGAWSSPDMAYLAYRAQYHMFAFGKHLVGDRATGGIYEMNINFFTDIGGGPVRWVRRTPYLIDDLKWVTFPLFQVDIEVGLGTNSGQGVNPQVMLRWSNDGAKTWSHERTATIGRKGAYQTRVQFQALGAGRNRVFELSGSDPVPMRIANAYVEARVGRN